jgi:hypothetical protein
MTFSPLAGSGANTAKVAALNAVASAKGLKLQVAGRDVTSQPQGAAAAGATDPVREGAIVATSLDESAQRVVISETANLDEVQAFFDNAAHADLSPANLSAKATALNL